MIACTICGSSARAPFDIPPSQQPPDLDGRPGEPARSTLPRWVQICSSCGAAAPDLSRLPAAAARCVTSEAYRLLLVATPIGTRAHLCWAAILSASGDRMGAAQSTLHAAWAADDAGKPQRAVELRRNAAADWAAKDDSPEALHLIDVLRRAGSMERAEALAARIAAGRTDGTTARLIAFQRARIKAGDTARHQISSAVRPPSHTPHVSHGSAARSANRSLLDRLLSRG